MISKTYSSINILLLEAKVLKQSLICQKSLPYKTPVNCISIYQIYISAFPQTYIISEALYKYNLHTIEIITGK